MWCQGRTVSGVRPACVKAAASALMGLGCDATTAKANVPVEEHRRASEAFFATMYMGVTPPGSANYALTLEDGRLTCQPTAGDVARAVHMAWYAEPGTGVFGAYYTLPVWTIPRGKRETRRSGALWFEHDSSVTFTGKRGILARPSQQM